MSPWQSHQHFADNEKPHGVLFVAVAQDQVMRRGRQIDGSISAAKPGATAMAHRSYQP